VVDAVRTKNWFEPVKRLNINTNTYKPLEGVKDELTICSTVCVILRGTRIVIPKNTTAAHNRSRPWRSPRNSKNKSAASRESLVSRNWQRRRKESQVVCCMSSSHTKQRVNHFKCRHYLMDFKKLTGEGYLLVIYHDYSRYPVVKVVPSIVVPRLHKVFAEFGVPKVVCSDNGPPFNGKDFSKFASVLVFNKHRKVTPLWPRANGEVERFMRTLKKAIEAAKASGRP